MKEKIIKVSGELLAGYLSLIFMATISNFKNDFLYQNFKKIK